MINGNAVGGITGYGKTFILTDENGNELMGVVVNEEVVFTADPLTDIREGKVAATDMGVVTGAKNIPAYRTEQASYVVFAGEDFVIPLSDYDFYDYTKIQCIIAKYTSDPTQRMSADRVVIGDAVYTTNSSEVLSNITKDSNMKSINFNITNNTEDNYIIYYFTFREEV